MVVATFLATALYAIVGGPSVGKTSIIEELNKMGEETVREVATDYIMEQQQKGIGEPWAEEDFQLVILQRHLEREKDALAKLKKNKKARVFSDRGILDGHVYTKFRKQEGSKSFEEIRHVIDTMDVSNHYKVVFFVLPHGGEAFESEKKKERPEATAEALKISEITRDVYSKNCTHFVEVPANMTPKERAEFILAQIEKHSFQEESQMSLAGVIN